MRLSALLLILVSCGGSSVSKTVAGKCGKPPQMSGWAMSRGLEINEDPSKDELVVVDPDDYQAMIKWRDCVVALP